jgi:hypothetical protein
MYEKAGGRAYSEPVFRSEQVAPFCHSFEDQTLHLSPLEQAACGSPRRQATSLSEDRSNSGERPLDRDEDGQSHG